MNRPDARSRIRGKQASGEVRQAVRYRRGTTPDVAVRGMSGGVVAMPGEDDFIIGHLAKAPMVYNHQRAGGNLHVSDVLGKCVRKLALSKRLGTPLPPERLFDGMGITFAQGNAIHDYVKERMVAGHPEKVYGAWSCACQKTMTPKLTTLAAGIAKTCPHCETPVNRYHEAKIVDDEYGITGSPDVLMYLGVNEAYHITEIKSINGDAFKELVRPQPDHILQVAFYWHLMQRAGYTLTDRASILYSSKAYTFKSPYKEFSIDVQSQVKRLEPYIEDAKAYKASLGGGPLPLRSVCATEDTTEAKKCPMRSACFSVK